MRGTRPAAWPTLQDAYRARAAIRGLVRSTPLEPSPALREAAGAAVHLKLENLQVSGAFKARGAANALLSLDPRTRSQGVVAVSTGNHGRAVALMAAKLGVPAVVCVSERVPEAKLAALRATGCELHVGGDSQDEAEATARALVQGRGLHLVHPFDDASVIAGQATLGLELLEQLPDLATAIVPLSGGGLMSGVALALKAASKHIRVVGVSMEGGAAMAMSLDAGRVVTTPEVETLADSLQGGIGETNALTFAMVDALMDEVVLVDEASIAEAMRFAFLEHKQVLEGAAAVGIAALRSGRLGTGAEGSSAGGPTGGSTRASGPAVVICSGGNVDLARFLEIVEGEGRT